MNEKYILQKERQKNYACLLNDWLIYLVTCQTIQGYFILKDKEIAFNVRLYLKRPFVFAFGVLAGGCTPFYRIRIIFKQIYLTNRWDPNRYYCSSRPGSTIRCSLLSCQEISLEKSHILCRGYRQCIRKHADRTIQNTRLGFLNPIL